jgi:hypothetical protein
VDQGCLRHDREGVVTVGGGTVQVRFVDSEWTVPSAELVQSVQTQVDPTANQGEGMGTAPIGHAVNVQGATGAAIDVSFTLTFDTGVTWSSVQGAVKAAIQSYFDELVTLGPTSTAGRPISQIETKILNVAGVIDITGTRNQRKDRELFPWRRTQFPSWGWSRMELKEYWPRYLQDLIEFDQIAGAEQPVHKGRPGRPERAERLLHGQPVRIWLSALGNISGPVGGP